MRSALPDPVRHPHTIFEFWLGGVIMGKFLFSLAFATALLAVASSEASANFVCQAVGARSVGYGRAYVVADAKWQALIRCERRSGVCTSAIAFRRIDY